MPTPQFPNLTRERIAELRRELADNLETSFKSAFLGKFTEEKMDKAASRYSGYAAMEQGIQQLGFVDDKQTATEASFEQKRAVADAFALTAQAGQRTMIGTPVKVTGYSLSARNNAPPAQTAEINFDEMFRYIFPAGSNIAIRPSVSIAKRACEYIAQRDMLKLPDNGDPNSRHVTISRKEWNWTGAALKHALDERTDLRTRLAATQSENAALQRAAQTADSQIGALTKQVADLQAALSARSSTTPTPTPPATKQFPLAAVRAMSWRPVS